MPTENVIAASEEKDLASENPALRKKLENIADVLTDSMYPESVRINKALALIGTDNGETVSTAKISTTTVLWIIQYRQLKAEKWQNWKDYPSEESAQIGLEHHRTAHPSTEWRPVKETVTVEEVEPNAALAQT